MSRKKYSKKNIICEEPDLLQKKFLAENILCQEKKYSEENIFVKSQTHCKRISYVSFRFGLFVRFRWIYFTVQEDII